MSLLSNGQALILVDGIDEIGNAEKRTLVRNAIFQGRSAYPNCHWIATSRETGYSVKEWAHEKIGNLSSSEVLSTEMFKIRRILPFDDSSIAIFCKSWYRAREEDKILADECASELISAIRKNKGTNELARIPNLLTMMALIHRKLAFLPDGRAMLFDSIVDAYLEHIDQQRGITDSKLGLSLFQKKKILSLIAYEMQKLRSGPQSVSAPKSRILKWPFEIRNRIGARRNRSVL